MIGPGSGVPTNVEARAFVLGYPAIPHKRALEQFVYAGRQKRLHQKVDDIASRLERAGTIDQEVMGALAL